MPFIKVPKHVGIILDGNRRFAKKLMMKPWMGHEWGANKFKKFLEWCFELGIEEVTAYVLSIQNFNRPKEEFDYIMGIFKKESKALLQPKKLKELKDKGVRINFIGRQYMLPKDLQEIQNKIMDATSGNKPKIINFAMAYGGREEVIDAVKKISEKIKNNELDISDINEEAFSKNLYTDHAPDLIIRTGGEKRTSNFLIWQSNYSEWIFIEKSFPELEKEDLINSLEDFAKRERRFGH